jgi:hypothetical protein
VDELFIIFDQTKPNSDTIINLINKVEEHLEFKASEEENNTIHYLVLSLSRNTYGLVLNIYINSTYIDFTVIFTSNHPHNQKLAAFIFRINRMINMTIKNAMVKHEWQKILEITLNNSFPRHVINDLREKQQLKKIYRAYTNSTTSK